MGTENQPPLPAAGYPPADIPPASMRTELEKQRQVTARLLGDLGSAITRSARQVRRGANSAARRTGHAAQYVQEHYVRDWVAGLGRLVRKHPASSMAVVVLAGYAVGRALRRR